MAHVTQDYTSFLLLLVVNLHFCVCHAIAFMGFAVVILLIVLQLWASSEELMDGFRARCGFGAMAKSVWEKSASFQNNDASPLAMNRIRCMSGHGTRQSEHSGKKGSLAFSTSAASAVEPAVLTAAGLSARISSTQRTASRNERGKCLSVSVLHRSSGG